MYTLEQVLQAIRLLDEYQQEREKVTADRAETPGTDWVFSDDAQAWANVFSLEDDENVRFLAEQILART